MTEIPVHDLKSCPRCGAGLSAQEAVQGLCAGCLFVAALDSRAEGESAPRQPSPSIESLAPHFPDLELVELVGQGGMGAVYRVRQKKLARFAALKILALDGDATPAFAERFEREARTLASLGHENIVAIYDQGRAGPHWYLLMEYVDGVSLRQMIRAREVDPRTALGLVAQICDALQCAHDRGVVHRDVKPENVLVDRRGRVKILDFGLAKLLGQEPRTGTLTETGQVMGTPRYMAPEQWERPLTVDHRADIYAVGVVFYELLTGELPIGAFQLPSHFAQVDARVDPVVMKTLAKEPERRYQHASEVKTEVQRIQTEPPPERARHALGQRRERHGVPTWFAVSALGCLVVLAFVFAVSLFLGPRLTSADDAAREAARDVARDAAREAAYRASKSADVARANGERIALREAWIDTLTGPPLTASLGTNPSQDQLRRAAAKFDALWRAYLYFENDRTAVESVDGSRVTMRVSPLHGTEVQFLGAFAESLSAPTGLELDADARARYRVSTNVGSVDRLSPALPEGTSRVQWTSADTLRDRATAHAQIAEFLGGAENALPEGWFPGLATGLEVEVELAPFVVAYVVSRSTNASGNPLERRQSFTEPAIEAAGLARFVELARDATAERMVWLGSRVFDRDHMALSASTSTDDPDASLRADEESGGPRLDRNARYAQGWSEAEVARGTALLDAAWRVLLALQRVELETSAGTNRVRVTLVPLTGPQLRELFACVRGLSEHASLELEPGRSRRYRVRCAEVVVERTTGEADSRYPYTGAKVERLLPAPPPHIGPADIADGARPWLWDALVSARPGARLADALDETAAYGAPLEQKAERGGVELEFEPDGRARGFTIGVGPRTPIKLELLDAWNIRPYTDLARGAWRTAK